MRVAALSVRRKNKGCAHRKSTNGKKYDLCSSRSPCCLIGHQLIRCCDHDYDGRNSKNYTEHSWIHRPECKSSKPFESNFQHSLANPPQHPLGNYEEEALPQPVWNHPPSGKSLPDLGFAMSQASGTEYRDLTFTRCGFCRLELLNNDISALLTHETPSAPIAKLSDGSWLCPHGQHHAEVRRAKNSGSRSNDGIEPNIFSGDH